MFSLDADLFLATAVVKVAAGAFESIRHARHGSARCSASSGVASADRRMTGGPAWLNVLTTFVPRAAANIGAANRTRHCRSGFVRELNCLPRSACAKLLDVPGLLRRERGCGCHKQPDPVFRPQLRISAGDRLAGVPRQACGTSQAPPAKLRDQDTSGAEVDRHTPWTRSSPRIELVPRSTNAALSRAHDLPSTRDAESSDLRHRHSEGKLRCEEQGSTRGSMDFRTTTGRPIL